MSYDDYSTPSHHKNQILLVVDNQTPFTLIPDHVTFSDWGDFVSGPTTVKPYDKGAAGHLLSSKAPFVGSAGIAGYSIRTPNGTTVHLRLLASNPYLSVRDNWACVSISSSDDCINQDAYNTHYYNEPQSATYSLEGKTLKLAANIGSATKAIATYILTYV